MDKKIIFSEKFGLCSGVFRALDIVDKCLENATKNVYIYHEIVHNNFVIDNLKKRGAIFVQSLDDVPDYSEIIFSAHGVSKAIELEAKNRHLKIIDATCVLVKKNHNTIENAINNGNKVIFIGKKNHDEVIGCLGRGKEDEIFLVENINDIDNLPAINGGVIQLSQTTLSKFQLADIEVKLKEKYPQIKNFNGICNATDCRQNAIKDLSKNVDLVLVIGSKNSSNSVELVNISKKINSKTFLIDNPSDLNKIDFSNIKVIGISAGASTPKEQIDNIIKLL